MPLSAVTFGGHDTVSSGSTSGDARPQVVAQDADLDLVVGVGQHGGGGHLRAGAGRGRHADQRQDRAGDLVVADVIARLAAVGQDDGGDLGQVHVAAAAEAEDGVGPKLRGRPRWRRRRRACDGSGSPPEKTSTATPASLSGACTRLDEAGLDEDRIGDEQDAASAETAGDVAELAGGIAAEEQLAGGVEGPGGAHGELPWGVTAVLSGIDASARLNGASRISLVATIGYEAGRTSS